MPPTSPLIRIAPYGALVLLGALLVVTVGTADPGERLQGRDKLVALIEREDERSRRLRAELDEIQVEILALQERAAGRERRLGSVRDAIDGLSGVAGLSEVTGQGMRVELRDSTLSSSPTGDPNDLVIHEQDLQAVVNALWLGGAEAMAVNGERITSASAVRCVGNTLLLHGSVYAPPYVIEAIGSPERLARAMDRDPLVQRFMGFVREFRLGYSASAADLSLPAFRGIVRATVATPASA